MPELTNNELWGDDHVGFHTHRCRVCGNLYQCSPVICSLYPFEYDGCLERESEANIIGKGEN